MVRIRKSSERGHAHHGWLDTYHTFSFNTYYDPEHMQFRALRVINEDRVEPGRGFGPHPHENMEILTYVLEGALHHRDSMGNGSVMRPGDVQRMSAGTGVVHSEANHSRQEPVHFLQIWIYPGRQGLAPGYEQKTFSDDAKRGQLRLLASNDGRDGSLTLHQDAGLYAAVLEPGTAVSRGLAPGRHAWVQVARGGVELNGHALEAGDGAALSGESGVELRARTAAEVLVFDLA
jgi:redox-sensitive bicupin YhaK (pirin superfamily)